MTLKALVVTGDAVEDPSLPEGAAVTLIVQKNRLLPPRRRISLLLCREPGHCWIQPTAAKLGHPCLSEGKS